MGTDKKISFFKRQIHADRTGTFSNPRAIEQIASSVQKYWKMISRS